MKKNKKNNFEITFVYNKEVDFDIILKDIDFEKDCKPIYIDAKPFTCERWLEGDIVFEKICEKPKKAIAKIDDENNIVYILKDYRKEINLKEFKKFGTKVKIVEKIEK